MSSDLTPIKLTFESLPLEMKDYIVNCFKPKKLTKTLVKEYANIVRIIAQVNKTMHEICNRKLCDLKRTYELLEKYHSYQHYYEKPLVDILTEKEHEVKGNPQLFDALLTGIEIPNQSSIKKYDETIESDIKDIVKLMPQSINSVVGYIRCRNKVTPLYAACANQKIPLSIVEFLLNKGANPHDVIEVNGREISILEDLKTNSKNKERLSQIEKLFSFFKQWENEH